MSPQRITLGLAGLALAVMAALTVGSAAAAPTIANGDHTTPDQSTNTVDRDPHSFSAVMPTSICPDPSLPCEPGETH